MSTWGAARITDDILNATFAVEEKLRTNFSTASSLPCRGAPFFACPPIAGQAAVLGDRAKAADLMRLAWRNYTLPPYHMMREYSHYNFGMYITHAGSMFLTLYGMLGLSATGVDRPMDLSGGGGGGVGAELQWVGRNASLPEGWDVSSQAVWPFDLRDCV